MRSPQKLQPPALQLAPVKLDPSYEEAKNSTLRLFFSRLTASLNNVIDGLTDSSGIGDGSNMTLENLPTSDPGVAGQIWRDGTDLKVSEG